MAYRKTPRVLICYWCESYFERYTSNISYFCCKSHAAKWRFKYNPEIRKGIKIGLKKAHEKAPERMRKRMVGYKNPAWRGSGNPNYGKNARRNEKHPMWVKDRSKLKSRPLSEGREWRIKVFIRDNYTCQECGARNGNGKRIDLQAHHIKPYAIFPKLRFDINNGITLCLDCHKQTETYALNSKYQYERFITENER